MSLCVNWSWNCSRKRRRTRGQRLRQRWRSCRDMNPYSTGAAASAGGTCCKADCDCATVFTLLLLPFQLRALIDAQWATWRAHFVWLSALFITIGVALLLVVVVVVALALAQVKAQLVSLLCLCFALFSFRFFSTFGCFSMLLHTHTHTHTHTLTRVTVLATCERQSGWRTACCHEALSLFVCKLKLKLSAQCNVVPADNNIAVSEGFDVGDDGGRRPFDNQLYSHVRATVTRRSRKGSVKCHSRELSPSVSSCRQSFTIRFTIRLITFSGK